MNQKRRGQWRNNQLKKKIVGPKIEYEKPINLEISLHALIRSQNPKTMRIMGKIEGYWVTILIDIGSTHNFLDPAVLDKMKLPINLAEKVRVKVASGEVLPSEEKFKGV